MAEHPACSREDEATSWLWVGLWQLFIYITIPLARTIQEFVRDHGGKNLFLVVTFGVLILAVVGIVRAVRCGIFRCRPEGMLTLGVICGLFAVMTWNLRANPEESLHFVEYGVTSLLLFRALSHRFRDPSIYLLAAMLGCFFGIVDELIQWITPRRFFDFRDIGINVIAVLLVQLAIAIGIRPRSIQSPMRRTGFRCATSIAALNMLLLMFCLANNDQFKAWYTTFIAGADAVDEVTATYGYRITDPDIGTFYSRLPAGQLREQDRQRAAEVAAILDEYKSERVYERFLRIYPAYRDPFLVEARIHLFRRDRNASLAIKLAEDPDVMMEHAVIAYRENQILRSYFPQTLARSSYAWEPHLEGSIRSLIGRQPAYDSPVSRQVITRFTRTQLLSFLSVVLVMLVATGWLGGRRLPQ